MTTIATVAMRTLAADWKSCFSSAQISGIVGDPAHQARGGYHIGRRFQSASNYSVVRPDDRGGPDNAAAAIDMTLSPADMRLCTSRLVKVYSDISDPRRKYLNAFNGTLNNRQATRWDVYGRKTKPATPDHLTHVHLELRRDYVESPTAMAATLSILRGQSWSPVTVKKTISALGLPGILRRGSRGDAVKRIQVKVGVPADGDFGARTESAVVVFQKNNKLTADGIVGPGTWAKMFR